MKVGHTARAQLQELILNTKPLEGYFFRSVAFQYFHPDDVISGEGTRLHGGRFVPVGVPAVYGSADEETALREITARQQALQGKEVQFRDYPRLTYVLHVKTERNIDLSGNLLSELHALIAACSQPGKHAASQQVAELWIQEGIESLIFMSALGSGRNVAVYTANAALGSITVLNREALIAQMRKRLL